MKENYLAVDLGSSNGKMVLAGLAETGRLELQEVGRFQTPRIWIGGHLCIDIYRIYEEICTLLIQLGKKGIEIRSMGVDSWASDFGIVNTSGDLIGLPVFYRDARTSGMPEEVEKVISYESLYHLTTQRRTQDTTLCQLLALQKEHPEVLEGGNRFMHIGDLLMYLFSGKVCSEISVASYSQLFSMKRKTWEDAAFDLFGLPKTLQPPVIEGGTCLGRITEQQARKYGTNRFEVIAPAVHDTSSAGVAVPALPGENWAFIATGSWYLVSMELEKPADPALSYRYNLSNTGLAFGKTLLKRNVCAMWIIQECRRMWNHMGIPCDYPMIAALADRAVPFCAVIDTDDLCFYNPENMVESVVEYLRRTGQAEVRPDDIGQIARIVYESIAYKCRYALDALIQTTGRSVDVLYVIGGSSRVAFLNQMLASAMNREIVTGPAEASSVGNVLLQAYGSGRLTQEEVRRTVRETFRMERFYPNDAQKWDEHYAKFLQICKETL